MRCARFWAQAAGTTSENILKRFRIDHHYEAFEKGLLAAERYFQILRRQLDLDLDEAAMTAGWNTILGDELPGIRDVITALVEHYPLYVLTNTNPVHEKIWAARHRDLLVPFDAVFVSSTIRHRKPEAAVFEYVATQCGFPAGQILLLDDTAANVTGARACGWRALRVTRTSDILNGIRAMGASPRCT